MEIGERRKLKLFIITALAVLALSITLFTLEISSVSYVSAAPQHPWDPLCASY